MMKLLRWILIIVLTLVLIGTAALAFFWITFDANKYRPLLEEKLTEALGLGVHTEDLSLTWKRGLVAQATGVRVGKLTGEVPLLEAESILIRLDLLSFLRLRLGLMELEITKPQILLVQRPDGGKNWEFTLPLKAAQPAKQEPPPLLLSRAKIEKGRLYYRDETQVPPMEIELRDIHAQATSKMNGAIEIQGRLQENTIKFKGEVSPFRNPPQFAGKLLVEQLDLDRLTYAASQGEGRGFLRGEVNAEAEFQGAGKEAQEIVNQLEGKGTLSVQNGALQEVNFAREMIRKITVISGLEAAVISTVPEEFRDLFMSRDTAFETLQAQFSLQAAQLAVERFLLKSEHFTVEGQGKGSLAGDLSLKAQFTFMEKVSDYLIHRVNELSVLTNAERQIVIPLTLQGRVPQLHLYPDVGGLARKVVVQQGARLLEEGLGALSKIMGEKEQ